ncbi:hypothetical protein M409DRAFT_24639 [Zasmidium cellare ATCC 36951]|uniref:Uncharacterized protein n=1 Tax=Zasmidium cellare ATCC 36951 TaxID=1080233 RepID=A0A6A6CIM9_ZASCE|nr:uncharacterized protein M409DRAFT_24639 [Zasmidium cellare ATCC 36951]KAF2165256.1 hypothetical protein M409DRAFT_24639 [Zasmidium cellare ATCC 36951]
MAPYQRYAVAAALATVISAAPQKLDYAELTAAPTVADGPSAIDTDVNGQQTATLLTSFAVTGATTASATPTANVQGRNIEARGVVSSDVTDSTYNAKLGDVGQLTTVNRGVTYWINGASTHNFFGNIANFGRIFISQTNYLKSNPYAGGQTSDWVGHDANNGNLQNAYGALIQLNDIGSASAPT